MCFPMSQTFVTAIARSTQHVRNCMINSISLQANLTRVNLHNGTVNEVLFYLLVPAGGTMNRVKFFISWPILVLLYFTVPNCGKPRWENFFMLSFFLSTVWIAVFSYFMVWMVSFSLICLLSTPFEHLWSEEYSFYIFLVIYSVTDNIVMCLIRSLCLFFRAGDDYRIHTGNTWCYNGHHFSRGRH